MGNHQKRRAGVLAALIALHALAIAGLMNMGIVPRIQPAPERALEVLLISPASPATPLPVPATSLRIDTHAPTLPEIPLPVVALPADPPASTAITAALPSPAPPPPAQAAPQSLHADTPISVDELEYLIREPPRYPVAARRARAEGTVYLRLLIDPQGIPQNVQVHRSCGHPMLDTAALDAARKFRFKPHRIDGVARAVQVIVPVEFSLTLRTAHNP
jgi:protein TonB